MTNKYCTGGCKTRDLVYHSVKRIKDVDSDSESESVIVIFVCRRCGKKK